MNYVKLGVVVLMLASCLLWARVVFGMSTEFGGVMMIPIAALAAAYLLVASVIVLVGVIVEWLERGELE